jgi:hypothetical protein
MTLLRSENISKRRSFSASRACKLSKYYTLIWGFRRDVDEICGVLGNYTASCGNYLPTFRNNVSVPSSWVKIPSSTTHIASSTTDLRDLLCGRPCHIHIFLSPEQKTTAYLRVAYLMTLSVALIHHIMRRNCLLKHVIEGKIEGRIEVTGRRGRRHKH